MNEPFIYKKKKNRERFVFFYKLYMYIYIYIYIYTFQSECRSLRRIGALELRANSMSLLIINQRCRVKRVDRRNLARDEKMRKGSGRVARLNRTDKIGKGMTDADRKRRL